MEDHPEKIGTLIVSLDFELMWGLIGSADKDGYGQTNVKQVPLVIDKLLALFAKYGIHATFATVGMIMYQGKEELMAENSSALPPSYKHRELSPYDIIPEIRPEEECLFFQPKLVHTISATSGMEIGTHTYSHYYCWEQGQTIDQFEDDLKRAVAVAEANMISVRSIVFPRNNVSEAYLQVCGKYGITSYRGNAERFYKKANTKIGSFINRVFRFIDSYINIGGDTGISYDKIDSRQIPVNVPASRFVRPYSKSLHFFDWLRLRRIKGEMEDAAREGKLYHLWWHPHNFGSNIEENMHFIESVLKIYQDYHQRYKMQSCTMNEFREQLVSNT